MTPVAERLAAWACAHVAVDADRTLARRSVVDTLSVALAARDEPVLRVAAGLGDAGRWAVAGHVLDFDDLHMPTTTHISTVCVPVALACGGDEAAYLAGAGVMARLGMLLGWSHYSAGWHATTTTGALAAAVTAARARGLDADGTARAMALAVPAAGGVQRAFGTDAKSLQVGLAADAGVRAAKLAAAGATADLSAVDAWLALVGGDPDRSVELAGDAVADGLAVKVYPCCYALQRPIAAVADLADGVDAAQVRRVRVRTPAGTVQPLIHHRPRTGLQGKFSLEYAVAAALLDAHQGFASFTDAAVQRPEAQRLVELVEVELTDGGDWLLAGEVEVEVQTAEDVQTGCLTHPPGSPARPASEAELGRKVADCLTGLDVAPEDLGWDDGAALLRRLLP
jgi:2-methylcitrate dehydratase PrpD